MAGPRSATLQSYFVWEPPSRGITILLNLRLIEGMKTWLDQAYRSGHEAGGILLGSIDQDTSGRRIVTIEDCAAIRFPHRSRPQFTLNANDSRPLESAVVRWREQREARVTPVGFTRSHLRPGLYLDQEDFSLFWNHFPDPGSVFLLVRPEPETVAGFFFWERGELHRQDSYLPFPFDPVELSRDAAHTVLRGPSLAIEAAPQTAAPAVRELPAVGAAPSRMKLSVQPGDRARLAWIGATLAILLWSAILWQPRKAARPTSLAPAAAELGLRVDHLGPTLRLTWNPHSSLVESAGRGVLWVSDGSTRKKIELDGRQLAEGSVMYVPDSEQVEFRLELDSRGKPVSNSILSFAPAAGKEVAEVDPPVPALTEPPVVEAAPRKAKPRPIQRPPGGSAPVIPTPAPPAPERPSAAVQEQAAVVPPPEVERPSSFVRQALPTVSFTYEYAAIPERARRKGIDKIPVIRLFHRHHKPEPDSADSHPVVSAKPLQPFKPHVPSAVAQALPGEWRVDVKATIDERGRVVQLEPVSPAIDARLVRLAMNALNDWDFEPANIEGRPVKSGLVVTFRFHIPAEPEPDRPAARSER